MSTRNLIVATWRQYKGSVNEPCLFISFCLFLSSFFWSDLSNWLLFGRFAFAGVGAFGVSCQLSMLVVGFLLIVIVDVDVVCDCCFVVGVLWLVCLLFVVLVVLLLFFGEFLLRLNSFFSVLQVDDFLEADGRR